MLTITLILKYPLNNVNAVVNKSTLSKDCTPLAATESKKLNVSL
jgi:hypothetical protein